MTSSNFITNLKDITFFTKISGQFMIIPDYKKNTYEQATQIRLFKHKV